MSGTPVWTTEIHAPINSGILGVGEYAYAGTLRKDLIALRRMTGEIVWQNTLGGRVKTTPVAGAGCIFVAQDDRTIQAFREERK
jgi:outer membrane protein assembly factor BamB